MGYVVAVLFVTKVFSTRRTLFYGGNVCSDAWLYVEIDSIQWASFGLIVDDAYCGTTRFFSSFNLLDV